LLTIVSILINDNPIYSKSLKSLPSGSFLSTLLNFYFLNFTEFFAFYSGSGLSVPIPCTGRDGVSVKIGERQRKIRLAETCNVHTAHTPEPGQAVVNRE